MNTKTTSALLAALLGAAACSTPQPTPPTPVIVGRSSPTDDQAFQQALRDGLRQTAGRAVADKQKSQDLLPDVEAATRRVDELTQRARQQHMQTGTIAPETLEEMSIARDERYSAIWRLLVEAPDTPLPNDYLPRVLRNGGRR